MDFHGRLTLWQRVVRAFERFDSWTAASLSEGGRAMADVWDRYSAFMDRFHVRGGKRVAADLACEGLTLSVGGTAHHAVAGDPGVPARSATTTG